MRRDLAARGLLSACLLTGLLAASSAPALTDEELEPFLNAMAEIQRKYVDETKVDTATLLRKASEGVVNALDAESLVLDPAPPPGPAGPGFAIGVRGGLAHVIDVIEGGAAEAAGLKVGDHLLQVDGKDTGGEKRLEIERFLAGSAGSKVWLLWEDEDGTYREAQVERTATARPAWRRVVMPGAEFIQVFRLDEAAADQIRSDLASAPAAGGAVLDLRRCAGGDPDAAIALADALLPGGLEIVTGRGVNAKSEHRYEATRKSKPVGVPLVLLVGPGTRGAPEILAAALIHHRRALAVGKGTFGYAARQKDFALPSAGGRKLRLTVERFTAPSGICLTGTGVGAELSAGEALPRRIERELERTSLVGRLAERLFAAPPAAFDAAALQAGNLALSAQESKGKSVAERRGEFERAFQTAAEALVREAGLGVSRDTLEQARLTLISRVRVELAKRHKSPEDALVVRLREDPEAAMGLDLLRAVRRMSGAAQ
ncbi:MAG: S41 family peptidase [Candidatus Coatesbacteria bacterium]